MRHLGAKVLPFRLDVSKAELVVAVGGRMHSVEEATAIIEAFLAEPFSGREPDITEENLQARIRGNLLMALSNKFGWLVLTTGNKSEMSVGYATLYGDMCGGYNVLKDVYKTTVFDLCHWRNAHLPEGALGRKGKVIPERIITKPPSAELRPDQKDSDSLPPYPVLDAILNNTDRKAGHLLPVPCGHLFAVDHGVTFSVVPKLRQCASCRRKSGTIRGRSRRERSRRRENHSRSRLSRSPEAAGAPP